MARPTTRGAGETARRRSMPRGCPDRATAAIRRARSAPRERTTAAARRWSSSDAGAARSTPPTAPGRRCVARRRAGGAGLRPCRRFPATRRDTPLHHCRGAQARAARRPSDTVQCARVRRPRPPLRARPAARARSIPPRRRPAPPARARSHRSLPDGAETRLRERTPSGWRQRGPACAGTPPAPQDAPRGPRAAR